MGFKTPSVSSLYRKMSTLFYVPQNTDLLLLLQIKTYIELLTVNILQIQQLITLLLAGSLLFPQSSSQE